MQQHLYLTGYRGTGKTSVGVTLAKSLGRLVIDLDQVIEANAGKSIREIFDQGGEPLFRRLETEALTTVADAPRAVVSLGGGAILSEENRAVIRQSGICFWLDADAQTIAERIHRDQTTADRRPPLTSLGEIEEIRQLLSERRDLYEAAANHRIQTAGKSVDEVASEILAVVQNQMGQSAD
jgi:shikimate kinase